MIYYHETLRAIIFWLRRLELVNALQGQLCRMGDEPREHTEQIDPVTELLLGRHPKLVSGSSFHAQETKTRGATMSRYRLIYRRLQLGHHDSPILAFSHTKTRRAWLADAREPNGRVVPCVGLRLLHINFVRKHEPPLGILD